MTQKTQKTYTFTITLQGTGPTIEDAWIDALVEFHSDPSGVPDDEYVELIHEETLEEESDEEDYLTGELNN